MAITIFFCSFAAWRSQSAIHAGPAKGFTGHCKDGTMEQALQSLEFRRQQGQPITSDMIYHLLQACSKHRDLLSARRLYALTLNSVLASVTFLADNFIRLFAFCGSLGEADSLFYKVQRPSIHTWNSVISAHARYGNGRRALQLYCEMKRAGMKPDKVTFLSVGRACIAVGGVDWIRPIHEEIVSCGLLTDVTLGNTLLDMYAKCGYFQEAQKLFDDMSGRNVVTWSAMISGYTTHGHNSLALELFETMQLEGINPNTFTFSSAFKACGNMGAIRQGSLIHDKFIRDQIEADDIVDSALVDMYARCGSLKDARRIFNHLQNPDIVSWGAMISGYAVQGAGYDALELFGKLEQEGIWPNRAIFLSVAKACRDVGATDQGKLIHDQLIRSGLEADMAIGSALVDMYATCGSLENACNVFEKSPNRDAVTWGALIAGCALHGRYRLAWECLEGMERHGFKPGETAFTNVLNACSHAGLLEEGQLCFLSMRDYGIIPNIQHFGCVVDLLSRAGRLSDAEAVLQTLPMSSDIIIWRSLLACCKTYGNLGLGKRCFNQALDFDPNDA